MPELTAITDNLQFNWDTARSLATQLRNTATTLTDQIPQRAAMAGQARQEWRGAFAEKFDARMNTCSDDARRLAEALTKAAQQVDELARLARDEQDRRLQAQEWKQRHDAWKRAHRDDNWGERAWNNLFGDDEPKPPKQKSTDPPRLPIDAPTPQGR
jgi:uncharacterized protein YukE